MCRAEIRYSLPTLCFQKHRQFGVGSLRDTGACALGEALKTNTSLERLGLVSSAVFSVILSLFLHRC